MDRPDSWQGCGCPNCLEAEAIAQRTADAAAARRVLAYRDIISAARPGAALRVVEPDGWSPVVDLPVDLPTVVDDWADPETRARWVDATSAPCVRAYAYDPHWCREHLDTYYEGQGRCQAFERYTSEGR